MFLGGGGKFRVTTEMGVALCSIRLFCFCASFYDITYNTQPSEFINHSQVTECFTHILVYYASLTTTLMILYVILYNI